MRLKGLIVAGAIAVTGAALLNTPAEAGRRHHGYHDRGYYYDGGPRVSFDVWVGGSWRHDRYYGRNGWWWVAGPDYYYYPEPIYPYPAYAYPVYGAVAAPPAVQAGPAPEQNWYYCDSPKGYYPYVSQCSTAWRAVPATPPGPIR